MNVSRCVSQPINENQLRPRFYTDNRVAVEQPIAPGESGTAYICSVVISMLRPLNRNNSFHTSHNNTKSSFRGDIRAKDADCQVSAMSGDSNLDKMDEIAALEYDWNGYGAQKFSNELIEKCKSILCALPVYPQIYPTGRQSIQFQYELEDRSYLEFEIFEAKTVCLLVPKRKYSSAVTENFSEFEADKIKEIVKNFYGQSSNAK